MKQTVVGGLDVREKLLNKVQQNASESGTRRVEVQS